MSDPTPQQAYHSDTPLNTTTNTSANSSSLPAQSQSNNDQNPILSAAQLLQQQHESISSSSSIDPFPPTLQDSTTANNGTSSTIKKIQPINIEDEAAFPSLSMGSGKKDAGLWGAGGSGKIKSTASSNGNGTISNGGGGGGAAVGATERVSLPAGEIHIHPYTIGGGAAGGNRSRGSARENEPTTLGEVMKLIMRHHPTVTLEASTSRNVTTFILKGKSGTAGVEEVASAKRELLGRLAKRVSVELEVPASLRGFIVGAKGKTLKTITETSGASVNVPARDTSIEEVEIDDDSSPEGPLISITISGDSTAVASARAQIMSIVAGRVAKLTTRIESISKDYWGLLMGPRGSKMVDLVNALGFGETVTVGVPGVGAAGKESVITVTGERESVGITVKAILTAYDELRQNSKTLSISVNKRQHRFLVGPNADEILEVCGCAIELPAIEDESELVTIRGPQAALVQALGLVMEKANAIPVISLDLKGAHSGNHDKLIYAASVTRYLTKHSTFRQLSLDHTVEIFLPSQAATEAGSPLIDIVGSSPSAVAEAKLAIINIVRALPPSRFLITEVDSLLHRYLSAGKNGVRIKGFEKRGAEMILPTEEERSDVLLVFSGEGNPEPILNELRGEIQSIATEGADITSLTITIPHQFHKQIIGTNGTTLNAIIGEDRLVNVIFGSSSKSKGTQVEEDSVVIRGTPKEIERVQKEMERIVVEAKDTEITNSYVTIFEIDQAHVRHVVGKAGAAVNKLRESLGVNIDFEELAAEVESKQAKNRVARSKVTIKGRKENVEEAKKRILSQEGKLADETTSVITLPASFDRGSLIGKQGVYLKRLETTYDVRINFPKDRKNGEAVEDKSAATNNNEITIRGGKKGAEAAKKELVDLMEYEKENGNSISFTVTTKSLARIVGKAGAQINEIKDETMTTIDIDQQEDDSPTAIVSVRGTKAGIKKAQALIMAIAKEVDDETTLTVEIPKSFHTTLIGAGGANIRDLITKCGGPTDARGSGNTVRFPKQGESADTVTIRATKSVAAKIKSALEGIVATLQSRIVYAVAIPSTSHASIIGKAAVALQEIQNKYAVKVIFPGWKEYESTGVPVNAEEVKDANEKDIIKIVGSKEVAIAAAEEMSKGRSLKPSVTQTVQVLRKQHAHLAQGGRFFRSLPNGTRITHDGQKPPPSSTKAKGPPPTPSAAEPAVRSTRIDDDGDEQTFESEIIFQVISLDDGIVDDGSSIPWVIESASQEDLDRVVKDIERTLKKATDSSHMAYCTVPRALMPRIVGRGGAGLDKLRGSAGVEVEVVGRRDSNLLTIAGSPEAIEIAHQMILSLEATPARN